ncbi:hypothetical protein IW261DRAFT_1427855 [Armillaria novae-zelandiae]|uniref:Uncharacterized protein n=1 Tax=Armillaria novae-zelandiae TaxID=153914 RepID=A0AA39TQU1_9AGAR|nr:hypothetical protein IW261DRAFT_1427855 [Armillaria novae-zelandiae]
MYTLPFSISLFSLLYLLKMLLHLWTICFIVALYCFYMHKIYPDLCTMVPIHTYSLVHVVTHTLPSVVGHRFAATLSVSVGTLQWASLRDLVLYPNYHCHIQCSILVSMFQPVNVH